MPIPELEDDVYDFSDLMAQVTRWFVSPQTVSPGGGGFRLGTAPCGLFDIEAAAGLGEAALAAALALRYDATVHFFNASEGITSPERALRHLCVQLIARYGLSEAHFAGTGAGYDAAFFRELFGPGSRRT